jgi:peptide/nickel transport system ATP-binding protein
LMEIADRDQLYDAPLHPYTKLLFNAAPIPDPEVERNAAREVAKGELPSPTAPPKGCVFHTRCPLASRECSEVVPTLKEKRPGHFAACIKI